MPSTAKPRKGARSRADIPPDVLAALTAGSMESASLPEILALDFTALAHAALPPALAGPVAAGLNPDDGITRRMAAAGRALAAATDHDPQALAALAGHPSDTVRGWVAYAVAEEADSTDAPMPLEILLARLRPFADDPHFGVREWAWMALRPRMVADPLAVIDRLVPWTAEPSENLRRFAVESCRPRGVWCAHVTALKDDPAPGLPLLAPCRADPSKYVRDSVANWLNDAGKTRPDWVLAVTGRWLAEDPAPVVASLVKRARRSLPA